jgi:RNA polymerase sigma-70 factor (ECF subfamily)
LTGLTKRGGYFASGGTEKEQFSPETMNKPSRGSSEAQPGRAPVPATAQDGEDAGLVEKAVGGDTAAFEKLFVKYRQRLFGVAWRVLHDEDGALDVVQDAFVKAYQQLGSLRGETRFFPWLRRIAVNLAIDRLRHVKRGVEVSFDEAQFGDGDEAHQERVAADLKDRADRTSPGRHAELSEFTDELRKALEELSLAHRTVFLLHAAEGMTYQEIADAMGCNIGTVMSRLFYARRQLQKKLAPHLEDEGSAA